MLFPVLFYTMHYFIYHKYITLYWGLGGRSEETVPVSFLYQTPSPSLLLLFVWITPLHRFLLEVAQSTANQNVPCEAVSTTLRCASRWQLHPSC